MKDGKNTKNDLPGKGRRGAREDMESLRRYDDILHLPHHVSQSHPQMAVSDRAAQFAPFAALTGYGAAIKETARLTDEMAELGEDSRENLDEKLSWLQEHLDEQPLVTAVYFQPDERKSGGAYGTASGTVKKIDFYEKKLILMDGTVIPMGYMVGLEAEPPVRE